MVPSQLPVPSRRGGIVRYTLAELIERARTVEMTPGEREQQRRSFAYGNVKIENSLVTRAMVDQCAEALNQPSNG